MENEKYRVLAVDDDDAVLNILNMALASSGMSMDKASNGPDALKLLAVNRYDMILMDINMEGMDGFQVIETLREKGITTPVMIISGRKEDYDTLYGLNIGADDYITKPFNPLTLCAKIKALIRRASTSGKEPTQVIEAGPFSFNTTTLRFYKGKEEVLLSPKESALMRLFMENENRVFPKDLLYETIWGNNISDENTIMVYINRLRQKIEDDPSNPKYIQTVRGFGYRFVI